jgi:hypothetical protein
MFKFRTWFASNRAKVDKLGKLIVKIGIFSVLYIVPAGIVIAWGFYETFSREGWERSYLPLSYLPPQGVSHLPRLFHPHAQVLHAAGFLIWSGNTVEAWQALLHRLFRIRAFNKLRRPRTHPGCGWRRAKRARCHRRHGALVASLAAGGTVGAPPPVNISEVCCRTPLHDRWTRSNLPVDSCVIAPKLRLKEDIYLWAFSSAEIHVLICERFQALKIVYFRVKASTTIHCNDDQHKKLNFRCIIEQ